jgi:hypothetical protein
MRATLQSAVLAVAALGGCYTTGEVGYRATYAGPSADVYVSTPDLVTVSPGVQVVADYDEPVFYTDGFYWRYYDGGWYRSNNYSTGWFYVATPPVAVVRIDRPYAYAHYRPRGYVARDRARYRPPEVISRDRQRETVVRDRRDVRPEPVVRERRDTVVRDRREPVRSAPVVREAPRPAAQPAPAPARRAPPAKADKDDRRDRDHDRDRH